MDEKLGSIKYMYVFMIFINGRGGGARKIIQVYGRLLSYWGIQIARIYGFVHMYRYKLQSVVIMFEEKLP